MAALSDYAENLLHKWLLTQQTATRPTFHFLALFTSAPSDSGGGTEVAGNGYSRDGTNFDVTGGVASNNNAVSFTATGGNWGTITHIAIFDGPTGGNMLWHGALDASKVINDGDTLSFAVGAIDLTLD